MQTTTCPQCGTLLVISVGSKVEPTPLEYPTVSEPSRLVNSDVCSGFDETCQDDPCQDCDLMLTGLEK
jgi:hypothetical protein